MLTSKDLNLKDRKQKLEKFLLPLLTSYFLLLTSFFLGCGGLAVIQDRLAPQQLPDGKILFRYYSPSAKTVSLAGDFNGWEYQQNQSRAIFLKKGENGIWQTVIPMPQGRYRYKYVIDYQSWLLDSNNPLTEDDGTGNLNSLIIVK